MEQAFGYVLFGVVIVAAIVAVITFAGARRSYSDIGKGGLFVDDEPRRPQLPAADLAERDDEIRQMLEARNARRATRGEEPLDVDDELRRLTQPGGGGPAPADAGLRADVRALVEAQNRRRVRQGREPLDVDAEVERQLRDLG